MRWTAEQQSAIEARNPAVLVSAAAGSGKTAVLVERVLSLLREGKRIDRMLIVTFTRAAAGEMRERIGRVLEEEAAENAHLRRQQMRLQRADICTLHVFCSRVLREHFEAAGIDPLARIADEEKLNALRQKALDDVLEAAYAAPTADENSLFSQFEDPQIVTMMHQGYDFLMAQADPWGWAEAACQEDTAHTDTWLPLLQSECAARLEGAAELLPDMDEILSQGGGPARYVPAWEADCLLMEELLAAARQGTITGGKPAFAALSRKKADPAEDPALADAYKALREEWKDRIKDALALLPADQESTESDLAHTLPALRGLMGLIRKMADAYFEYKQRKNYLDYGDLEHLTLKILQIESVRQAVAGSYDALFIDEYQDISGIQEAILNALHRGNENLLFMVGDVKQSIYRFRLADPTLFLRKYRDYALDADAPCRKILLQRNFRSDGNVLAAVNQVFAHAMRERETEIAYDEAAMLRPGGGRPLGAPVEIHLMTAPEDGEDGPGEITKGYRYEAAFAAKKIRELMRTVTVQDGDHTRPLRYRDIALLMRYASGRAPYIAEVLQQEGIPVYSDADARFYDLPEVMDLMNLLRVIDNPLQDIPLLSALRCPCFGFTEEMLARVRLTNRAPGVPFYQALQDAMGQDGPLAARCREAWGRFAAWRFLSRNLPVDTLIWRVLEESGLYMRAGALEEGELRQANLRLLAERAQGESAKDGLGAFLRETGRLHMSDDGKAAKTLGENEDVVRILTLHKSKGLEFPVVFLMETARPFRKGGEGTPLLLHAAYGAALKFVDGEKRLTRDTCAMSALKSVSEREARAEEARLLYVGMTRARERLIVVGSPKRLDKQMMKWARPATAYAAGSADCMLDWVMESLHGWHDDIYTAENGSLWRMEKHPAEEAAGANRHAVPQPPAFHLGPADKKTVARMTRRIVPQPALKTSVTAITKPLRADTEGNWESAIDKRMLLPEEAPLPTFLRKEEETTAAWRGTVTHKALGLADLALVRAGRYGEALDALVARGRMSIKERQAVHEAWLAGFYQSPLGVRALKTKELHREWAFNLRGEGPALIQGVIDLCFLENGRWVLADYKTDRGEEDEILSRYALQIQWYARALAVITKIPVGEAWLFALRKGVMIPVPLAEKL